MIHTEFLANQKAAADKLAEQSKGITTKTGGAKVTGFNSVAVAGAAGQVKASQNKAADTGFSFGGAKNPLFIVAAGLIIWFFLLRD